MWTQNYWAVSNDQCPRSVVVYCHCIHGEFKCKSLCSASSNVIFWTGMNMLIFHQPSQCGGGHRRNVSPSNHHHCQQCIIIIIHIYIYPLSRPHCEAANSSRTVLNRSTTAKINGCYNRRNAIVWTTLSHTATTLMAMLLDIINAFTVGNKMMI